MFKQFCIFLINVFFPPLGVLLLCGPEMDLIVNCLLFLLAVIPSHVHAFYISMTYFRRKRKVRKGKYPGPWRRGIYSEKVQNGGASSAEVRRLKKAQEAEGSGLTRMLSGRSGRSGRSEKSAMRSGSQKIPARAGSQRVAPGSTLSHRYSGAEVPQRISSRRRAY